MQDGTDKIASQEQGQGADDQQVAHVNPTGDAVLHVGRELDRPDENHATENERGHEPVIDDGLFGGGALLPASPQVI